MLSDDPYPLQILLQVNGILNPRLADESYFYLIGTFVFLLPLIISSGLFSSSENPIFSSSNTEKEELNENDSPVNQAILKLLSQPRKLLATILVGNNFVNVTFVIVSSIWLESIFNLQVNPILDFAIKVIIVTLLLLLFGEVVPKVYATKKGLAIAKITAFPLLFCQKLFAWLVYPMVRFTSIIDRRVKVHEHTV